MAKFNSQALKAKYQKSVNAVGIGAIAVASASAHASLDMSAGTEQLGLALAAIGALGAAKLAPSALSWVWARVNRDASRG
ncbi:Uncharacterised protein [Moraxella equi]|nr:Uncharacterised protein [Moraxella equi]STZ03013.1 Uncharacterised protein [Moraxella equi]